jgi:hypothetical protein
MFWDLMMDSKKQEKWRYIKMPPTYVTAGVLPEGTILTTIIEQVIVDGKPRLKKCFTQVSGSEIKRTENKKVKQDKIIEKGKEEMQNRLDSFANVDVQEEEL